jgi:hypothetical protein
MRKKIILKGPILTRSGYGEQTRFALRALRAREDIFDIYIQPITWGQTSWLNEHNEERSWVDKTIEKTIAYFQQQGQFDLSLQITIPNEWEGIAPSNVGFTAGIETTQVSADWLQIGNQMDRILDIKPVTVSYVIETINGVPIEDLCEDDSLEDLIERKLAVVMNMQSSVMERVYQAYDKLVETSNEEIGLENLKE